MNLGSCLDADRCCTSTATMRTHCFVQATAWVIDNAVLTDASVLDELCANEAKSVSGTQGSNSPATAAAVAWSNASGGSIGGSSGSTAGDTIAPKAMQLLLCRSLPRMHAVLVNSGDHGRARQLLQQILQTSRLQHLLIAAPALVEHALKYGPEAAASPASKMQLAAEMSKVCDHVCM